jgi:succinate dehydrogenase / fumarate reductase membrane anchor subunit
MLIKKKTDNGGRRDWLLQRISAKIMALYFVVIYSVWLVTPGKGYAFWHAFLMNVPMQLFSLLTVLALVVHGWIGAWVISTDYLPILWLRRLFMAAVAVILAIYMIWMILIVLQYGWAVVIF